MIESLVPASVAVSTAYGDVKGAALFPQEQAVVDGSVPKRREEFATARYCARQALRSLGLPPVAILPGEMGAPLWPRSVVGSITHCEGFRAAAVGYRAEYVAIGIDAEPHSPLPDDLLHSIARPEEVIEILNLKQAAPEISWDRLLFSAKESVYKAWFPLTRAWLGFEDASITFTLTGRFRARLLPADAPIRHFDGRWAVTDGIAATAVVIAHGEGHASGTAAGAWSPV